jgi:hypothetical protein
MFPRLVPVFLILALGASPLAFAQEMPPMGAPDEMKTMTGMVGMYDVSMDYKMDPSAEDWMHSDASADYSLILEGCAMKVVFKGELMGKAFTGHQMMSFNRNSGKWQSVWIDDMGASLSYMDGGMEGGNLVLFGTDVMEGNTYFMRSTSSNMTDDGWDWVMDMSMDQENWMPIMKATYARKGGSDSDEGGW